MSFTNLSFQFNVIFSIRKMLMPKKNRASIYEYLFKEGVLVCMKDTHLAKHPEIDVPNLHVMKCLQVHSCLMSISLHQCNSKCLVLHLVLEIEGIRH